MSPSKTFGRTRHPLGSLVVVIAIGMLSVALLSQGCSSSVDVSFRLVPPCSDQSLVTGANCAFIRVIISAIDPNDPLHPDQVANNLGPLASTCAYGEANCKIAGDELLGTGRMVDVLCYPSLSVEPVARGSSNALLFDDSSDGIGGMSLSLLMGNIHGFVETTVTDPAGDLGECSLMAQDQGRYGHASVVLDDGRVLTTGGIRRYGQGVEEILATAEIYDPLDGSHRLVLGADGMEAKMHASSGRAFHTMIRLRDGRVLVAGGVGLIQQGATTVRTALRSAEIFDPKTESFIEPMDMKVGRAHHAATMLATGEVLVTGGASYGANGSIDFYLDSAQVYNPAISDPNQRWEPVTNNLSTGRAFHQAVLLDPTGTQGKVIIIGGENGGGSSLSSVDIYNPSGNQFYAGVDVTMTTARSHFCAVRLKGGQVLVAGGTTVTDDPGTPEVVEFTPVSGVEIYDPAGGGSFGAFGGTALNLTVARMDHTCTLLDDGNVMIAGGLTGGGQATGLGELVRDVAGVPQLEQLPDQLDPERFAHSAVKMRNGWILLSGGLPNVDSAAGALQQSILFVPPPSFQ